MRLTPVCSSAGQKAKKDADVGTRENVVPRTICFGNITAARCHEIAIVIRLVASLFSVLSSL